MNTRLVLGLVLAAVAGGLIVTAASFAYAQSSSPQSNNYGYNGSSGWNYHCGMMCRGGMGQWGMAQGQSYPATWNQNTTRWGCGC